MKNDQTVTFWVNFITSIIFPISFSFWQWDSSIQYLIQTKVEVAEFMIDQV